ncbi:hypothetical protein EJB05_00178, partial [Eragrostis curvula]
MYILQEKNLTTRCTRIKSHAATVCKGPPEARPDPTPPEKGLPARSPSQTYVLIGKHPFSPEYHDRKGRLPPHTRGQQRTVLNRHRRGYHREDPAFSNHPIQTKSPSGLNKS